MGLFFFRFTRGRCYDRIFALNVLDGVGFVYLDEISGVCDVFGKGIVAFRMEQAIDEQDRHNCEKGKD